MIQKWQLFSIAGLIWCVAGFMVTSIGVAALLRLRVWYWWPAALVIYVVFYLMVFAPLVRKHENRILDDARTRLPFWAFFDRKSYIIMAVMMGGGMALRFSGVLPDWFLAFFYTGLGAALLSCGLRFWYLPLKHRMLVKAH